MNSHFVHRDHCDLCGSADKTVLISRDFTHPSVWDAFLDPYYEHRIEKSLLDGAKYEVACCSQCGFMWQVNIGGDELMTMLYDKWFLPDVSLDKKRYAELSLPARYAIEAYTIAKLLKRNPHQIKVLDYGMGWGHWCLMAKAFGYDVDGLELSEQRVAFATANGINVIGYADLTPEKYAFITTDQVFEHIPDPLGNLKSLVKSLRSGGYLRLWVPDSAPTVASLSNPDWKASHDAFHPLEHINYYTHDSLVRLGKEAGLQLIPRPRVYKFEYTIPRLIRERFRRGSYRSSPTHLWFRKA